jgi:cobalamin biosynthesis Mg chelatase CobN
MKVSFVAVALTLAATVAAQTLADLPECAFSCLAGGLTKTGCGTDIGCACKKADFVSSAVTCVKGKCNEADTALATKAALAICKAAGVDVTLPGGTTTSTSASTSTPTSTSTSASTSTSTTKAPSTTGGTSTSTTVKPTTTVVPPTVVPPVTNGTNGTTPITPPTNDDSAAGKLAVSGLLAAGLGLAVAFGL